MRRCFSRGWFVVVALACFGWLKMGFAVAEEAKITYVDHVRPIFREHCFACHNQNKATNDLALDSYERLMEGGASGAVIEPGDPDNSYLWMLVSHKEQPYMPPNQDPLPAEKLQIIQKWIQGGALKDSGSSAAAPKPKVDLSMTQVTPAQQGTPIMPENLPQEPILVTRRPAPAYALATAPWSPLAVVAGQKQLVFYHTESGQRLGIVPFPPGVAYDLKFSRSGAVLAAGGGIGAKVGNVVLYDVKTGKELTTIGDELDVVLACDVSPDLKFVLLGGPQKIARVFNVEDGSQLVEIKKHTDWIYAAAISPDGVLMATADRAGGLWVWEAGADREFATLDGHKAAVTALAWRPDSNVLASASEDGTIKLWDMNNGQQIRSINAHSGGATTVAFMNDGRLVSGGRDKTVKIWDISGRNLKTLPALPDLILRVAATYDNKRVVAADLSGEVRLIDIESGNVVANLPANPAPASASPPATAQATASTK